jgi:hypothetical protein
MLKQQASRAFSSEVAPGSRKENASKQKLERDDDSIFKASRYSESSGFGRKAGVSGKSIRSFEKRKPNPHNPPATPPGS